MLFSDFDVLEPDLLYISESRLDQVLTDKNVRGAPDLVVEVGSPSTRRRDEKLKYLVYELSLDNGDVLTTPLLPGLAIPLQRLFKD